MNSDYIKSLRLITQATQELDRGLGEMAIILLVLMLALGVVFGVWLAIWILRGGLSRCD